MCLWSMKTCSENKLEPHKDKLKQVLTCHTVTKLFVNFYSFIDVYAFHIEDLPQSWMKKICSKICCCIQDALLVVAVSKGAGDRKEQLSDLVVYSFIFGNLDNLRCI